MDASKVQHTGHGANAALPCGAGPTLGSSSCSTDEAGVAKALTALQAVAAAGPGQLALATFAEAAEYASQIEEISRTLEYVQILAASAVDRTRAQAIADASRTGTGRTWITGWDNTTGSSADVAGSDPSWPHGSPDPAGLGDAAFTAATAQASPDRAMGSPADDGCKNTAEFLRVRLRIPVAEAHRRISLAAAVLPQSGLTGYTQAPARPQLAAALTTGSVASRPATIITLALDHVSHHVTEDVTTRMEHALTQAAANNDADFLARIARHWTEAIDADGTEPSEHELRQRQGVFIRPARRGLNRLDIFATPAQYECLLTAMSTATNPRTTNANNSDGAYDAGNAGIGSEPGHTGSATATVDPDLNLDRRTRAQQLLDGLVGACKTALTSGNLPSAGGLRPQVLVTIDYRDLLNRLEQTTAKGPRYGYGTSTTGGRPVPDPGSIPGAGSFAFTGPVTPATVREIACDADIIPILLGSAGRILDIGRTTRIFPPHIRKAITARDHGCAFPNCTIPAPWCEAHHISYWSHGGPTNTDNGTLLCTSHHHLIHKEQWQVHVTNGVPWFIPPPHIDPRQKPQRNHHQT
ncbi:DUF222 domain-containing protein [Arthrobacter sp. G.S.26]|uniref:HNH endonuclease signature motif containing protein n=1 Tax=Arthrobacter sp. G.S.26 TaxID=3433706 RepID=UPI003D77DAF5